MSFDLFDPSANQILAAPTYTEFRDRLIASACDRCGLHARRTHIVVDRGNPASSILVIGEGPGADEDAQGKAFVGRSGQLLDKIMAAIGLDTGRDLLIANVVKCRPTDDEGQNRPPTPVEAETCFPYLRRQIDLVSPKVLLLLGATALRYMDPSRKSFSMAREAGRFLALPDYPSIATMVLYHPAALLRNPHLKADMWEHVKVLRRRLVELGILKAASGAAGNSQDG